MRRLGAFLLVCAVPHIMANLESSGSSVTQSFGDESCGEDAAELKLDAPLRCRVMATEQPKVFCYHAQQFNVWRSLSEVRFEVRSEAGIIPFVHGAAEDSLHGIIDAHVKVKRAQQVRHKNNLLPDLGVDTIARQRAQRRANMFISPLDLLSECPRPWAPHNLTCFKYASPFGRSCIAVSVPKSRGGSTASSTFDVIVTTSTNGHRICLLLAGIALLLLAPQLAKSKIFCYTSGVSLSVLLGTVLLLIFVLRRLKTAFTTFSGCFTTVSDPAMYKCTLVPVMLGRSIIHVPFAQTSLFFAVSIGGYGMAVLSTAGTLLRHAAVYYWEWLAAYLALFAAVGFGAIYRTRRVPESKERLRAIVIWSIRLLGVAAVLLSSASGAVSMVLGCVSGLFILRQPTARAHRDIGKRD